MTMEQTVYKIGEVAARLGLVDKNNNTLRSWAEEFGAFLSASANPPPGQPRRFTERDVQLLTAVRDYRAHHLSYEEIHERLHAGEHDVTGPLPEDAPGQGHETAFASNGHALVPWAHVETLLAPLAASVEEWRRLAEEYRGRLEARETRIAALEQRIDELYAQPGTLPQGDAPHPTTTTEAPAPAAPMTTTEAPAPAAPMTTTDAPAPVPGATSPSQVAEAFAPHSADPAPGVVGSTEGTKTEATECGDAAPLFPLPVVARTPRAGSEMPVVQPDMPVVQRAAPRRPWWRVWR